MDSLAAWRANVRKVYALRMLLAAPSMTTPIMVLFWRKVGMNTTEIFVVQAIFHAALAFFEVPTGYLADRFGRKPSVITGMAGIVTGFGLYSSATSVWSVVLAELVIAFGISCISGSLQALQYDSSLALKQQGGDLSVTGKSSMCFYAASAVFTGVGGFLGAIDLRLAMGISAAILGVGLFLSLTLREAPYSDGEPDLPIGRVVREHLLRSADLRWIVLYSASITALLTGGLWLYQDYIKDCGLPVWSFGLCYAGFNVVAAYASHWSRSREWRGSALLALPMLLAIGYGLLGAVSTSWSFLFILLLQTARGFNDVVVEVWLNRSVTSQVRATMLSVKSLCSSAMFAVLGVCLGLLGDSFGFRSSFLMLGLMAAVTGAWFWRVRPARA